jgi:hypothetical protein
MPELRVPLPSFLAHLKNVRANPESRLPDEARWLTANFRFDDSTATYEPELLQQPYAAFAFKLLRNGHKFLTVLFVVVLLLCAVPISAQWYPGLDAFVGLYDYPDTDNGVFSYYVQNNSEWRVVAIQFEDIPWWASYTPPDGWYYLGDGGYAGYLLTSVGWSNEPGAAVSDWVQGPTCQ